jgi:DNA-binding transcriptional LysR family regulator
MRFTLRQLSYFVAAGETGSITLASQRAHISQPSISAAISQLESQFGIQLFIRHHAQGLSLTPTGERFLDAARQLLRHANDLHDFADEIANRVAGPLRVGVFRTLAPLLMPALMSQFLQRHPQVEFSLYEGDESELTARLRSAELDVVVSYDQPTTDVLFEPLARLPTYVLLPENHRFARRSNVPLAEIAGEPFVLLDLPISREYFFSLFERLNILPNIYVASTQPETVRSYVAAGLGFSLLTAKPVNRRALTGEGLAYVALADDFPPMVLSVATLAGVRPSRAASAYLEYLRQTVSDQNLPGMEGSGA